MPEGEFAPPTGPPQPRPPHATLKVSSYVRDGWTFEAVKGCISGRADLEAIQERLHNPPSLPEMCFGSNKLVLQHQDSGAKIVFDALGALSSWNSHAPEPIRLKMAQKWSQMNAAEISKSNAKILDYDWTFTTDYAGSLIHTSRGTESFEKTEQRIERSLLLERAPILFSAEIPLYESEMDDNGVCSCTVRIRVMPKCWFVLLRFWLRVDDTIIRIREARYFCEFRSRNVVLQEVKHVEGTFEDLAQAGAPSSNIAFADADAASTAMQAVAPVGVVLLTQRRLLLSSAID